MNKPEKTYEELLLENESLKAELNAFEQKALKYKKIEKSLTIERELNLNLINALPHGIYRIKTFLQHAKKEESWQDESDSTYQFLFVNNRFCEIIQTEYHVLKENPGIIIDLVYHEDKADFVKRNVEANTKLLPFKWDGRFDIEGKITWLHFESLPYLLENGDVLWTGILYDNNERKKAEEEIIQKNNELNKLNAEKDKFFSIIAHDLKSPFNAIMGFSKLLMDEVHLGDEAQIKEFAEIILSSTQRATYLLANLMEWSQLQTGRMIFNPSYFEINYLIDDVFSLYKDIASQKKIALHKSLEPDVCLFADKAMLSTVLRNLVSNAIKFTMPEGKITISTKNIANELEVSVSDSGVGMPMDTLHKIFSMDQNISTYGTQNEKGTGLGLILCKEFIERHNGKIDGISEIDKGSTFYFTCPLKPNE